MLNPVSKNRNYLLAYFLVWVIVIVVHTFIVNFFYGIDTATSLADALVFNLLFAAIGYNLWYAVRFSFRDKSTLFDVVFNHLLVSVGIIAFWLALSFYVLKILFGADEIYMEFLVTSLPWRAVTGIFYYLFFILFYYLIMYYEDLQERLENEARLQNLVTHAELETLKSQINPHFLFNSLNSVSSLTISNPKKAQEMVIKLSDFLRYSLSHDKNEKTTLREEFENMVRYLDIEKVRFGKRLKFVHDVPGECMDKLIPNMILQPLIENAIKHGVYNSTEEVQIELTCKQEKDFLRIVITNDYDPNAVKKKGEGIGLKNIRKRLQLIYNRIDLLKTTADKTVFKAELLIPNR